MKSKAITPFTIFSIFFAVSVWGGWAYYINIGSGGAVRSAIVQAGYSGLMTLYMTYSAMYFFKKSPSGLMSYVIPFLGTMGHTGLLLILAHYLSGTPNLWGTVSLPLFFGSVYCFILSFQFSKQSLN